MKERVKIQVILKRIDRFLDFELLGKIYFFYGNCTEKNIITIPVSVVLLEIIFASIRYLNGSSPSSPRLNSPPIEKG
jgi:hypothetical protein